MSLGKLFVLSAPSGTGKTTLISLLMSRYNDTLHVKNVVTYTSRCPREGEVNGVDYHFVTIAQFKHMIDQNLFLEWNIWCDNYYGSPLSVLEDMRRGQSFILVIDVEGARRVRKAYADAVLIWLVPPSLFELERRLRGRGTDSEKILQSRLEKAQQEITLELQDQQYAECPLYDYHVINNDKEVAVIQLFEIMRSELSI